MALPKRAYTADYADLNHAVQSGMQQGSGGAAKAYRGQARQSGTAGAYGGQAYPSYAPYPQRERHVKAWEERNLPKPQPQNAQTADTGIERGSLLPGVNLLDEEIFKYFAGDLVRIPDAVQMGEEVFEVFLIILNCPRAEVFDPAMIEENGLGFFQRKTLRKPRIFNTCAMPHNRFFLPKKSRYCRVDKI